MEGIWSHRAVCCAADTGTVLVFVLLVVSGANEGQQIAA